MLIVVVHVLPCHLMRRRNLGQPEKDLVEREVKDDLHPSSKSPQTNSLTPLTLAAAARPLASSCASRMRAPAPESRRWCRVRSMSREVGCSSVRRVRREETRWVCHFASAMVRPTRAGWLRFRP